MKTFYSHPREASNAFANMVNMLGPALRHNKSLGQGELQAMFDLVSCAGFNPTQIVEGQIFEDVPDSTRKDPVNRSCMYKVVTGEEDNSFATGWLDNMLCYALDSYNQEGLHSKLYEQLIKSTPLYPIRLTKEGDLLIESTPNVNWRDIRPYLVAHTKDEDKIGVSIHGYCYGRLDYKRTTETQRTLFCRECNFRIALPLEIKTYGELRAYMLESLSQPFKQGVGGGGVMG